MVIFGVLGEVMGGVGTFVLSEHLTAISERETEEIRLHAAELESDNLLMAGDLETLQAEADLAESKRLKLANELEKQKRETLETRGKVAGLETARDEAKIELEKQKQETARLQRGLETVWTRLGRSLILSPKLIDMLKGGRGCSAIVTVTTDNPDGSVFANVFSDIFEKAGWYSRKEVRNGTSRVYRDNEPLGVDIESPFPTPLPKDSAVHFLEQALLKAPFDVRVRVDP